MTPTMHPPRGPSGSALAPPWTSWPGIESIPDSLSRKLDYGIISACNSNVSAGSWNRMIDTVATYDEVVSIKTFLFGQPAITTGGR